MANEHPTPSQDEAAQILAARQRVRESFHHRTPDGDCQCVYCTRDVEGLAEHAADYELRFHHAEARLKDADVLHQQDAARIAALEKERARLTAERDGARMVVHQHEQSLEAFQVSLNLCAAHGPDRWEGNGSCVLCEALAEYLRLRSLREKLGELAKKWRKPNAAFTAGEFVLLNVVAGQVLQAMEEPPSGSLAVDPVEGSDHEPTPRDVTSLSSSTSDLASHAETIRQLQSHVELIRSVTKTANTIDDVKCIRGLQERIRFTESFESLTARLALAEQETKELRTRVAPPVDCVAPPGTTADPSPGAVIPAERTEER